MRVRYDSNPVAVASDKWTPTLGNAKGAVRTTPWAEQATPVLHRSAVTAADVLAVPGTVTCTKQAGGSVTAGTHNVKVVAGNVYGRTTATAGDTAVTTETTNLTVRAAFEAVTGATFYDIYCSTDADPKWVGRITEAQRASGIKIDAVGSTAAGGTAGAVDIEVVGTGLQAAASAAVNTAYSVPEGIDCTGYRYADFDIICTRTGDAVAAGLLLVPFFYNSELSSYAQGQIVSLAFGGASYIYNSMHQRLRVDVMGNSTVSLAVAYIAGTGMSVDVYVSLS